MFRKSKVSKISHVGLFTAEKYRRAGTAWFHNSIITSAFVQLTKRQRQQLIVHLFYKWLVLDVHSELDSNFVPSNFLPLLSSAMKVLYINGKNVLHDTACCFGEMHLGQENIPLMPLSRMLFGLIAHNLKFFASDDATKLEAPNDHKSWYQLIYTLFGNKWAALHNGPMWSYIDGEDEKSQTSQMVPNSMSNCTCPTDILTEALQQTFGNGCRECCRQQVRQDRSWMMTMSSGKNHPSLMWWLLQKMCHIVVKGHLLLMLQNK